MNINNIIKTTNNKEYLILDIVELKEVKYLYCVSTSDGELTDEYIYLKEINDNGDIYVSSDIDDNIKETLTGMVISNYLNSSKDDEQDV